MTHACVAGECTRTRAQSLERTKQEEAEKSTTRETDCCVFEHALDAGVPLAGDVVFGR